MSRKSEEAYEHLFRYIDTEICSLNPTTFMTDYERAMRNALREVFPAAKLFTCWFHFCQAVKRHASQIPQFMACVRNNDDAAKLYHKFLCVPLLPAEEISETFNLLKVEAKAKLGTKFNVFLQYYERQSLKAVGIND